MRLTIEIETSKSGQDAFDVVASALGEIIDQFEEKPGMAWILRDDAGVAVGRAETRESSR